MKPRNSKAKLQSRIKKLELLAAKSDLVAITGLAEIYSDGKLIRRNNKKSLSLMKLGAKLNDPYLTWCLADAYYHGVGVDKSVSTGMNYYKRAAKLGVGEAITAMAVHNFEHGSANQKKQAVLQYKKAAKLGEPHAIHNLGICYSTGIGAGKNMKRAFIYFQKAAELGHVDAQFKTGWSLLYGEGISKNITLAKRFLKKAIKQGHAEAKKLLKGITRA